MQLTRFPLRADFRQPQNLPRRQGRRREERFHRLRHHIQADHSPRWLRPLRCRQQRLHHDEGLLPWCRSPRRHPPQVLAHPHFPQRSGANERQMDLDSIQVRPRPIPDTCREERLPRSDEDQGQRMSVSGMGFLWGESFQHWLYGIENNSKSTLQCHMTGKEATPCTSILTVPLLLVSASVRALLVFAGPR